MSKLIHPLGTIGGTISPFIDNKYNTTEPSANISFLVSENNLAYAMVDSEITEVKEDTELGKIIILKSSVWNYSKKNNNSPLYQTYCHLNAVDVKKGDLVKAGDTLGKTGKTGSLASSSCLTIFFSEDATSPKIKTINVSKYASPEKLVFTDLSIKEIDGTSKVLDKNSLQEYIHKIFAQTPESTSYATTTVTKDLTGEDTTIIASVVAQENNWGGNYPDVPHLAKSEAVCRVIRNRSYRVAESLTDAALSIADKQYDVSNNSYEAQFNHVAKINGQEIRFFDFVINVVSGTDYNFIERMGGLQPNYKEEELYGITGFMTTSQAQNFPGSIVAIWDDFACLNWKFYPPTASRIVNTEMPRRQGGTS